MRIALLSLELERRLVRVLLAGSFALVAWRVVPPPFEMPEPPAPAPTYTLVPLLGEPLSQAVDDADGTINDWNRLAPSITTGTCVPFLAPLVERPSWELQFVSASSGCMGDTFHDQYVVTSDGDVTWKRPNMPTRKLALNADELARIRTLDRKDCVRTEATGYGEAFYRIALAGLPDAEGGAHVSASSTMAKELDEIFEAAKERYRSERIAALGISELRLNGTARYQDRPIYRVDLAGSKLTVRHGRRVLVEKVLDMNEVVETLDRLQAPKPDVRSARGFLRSRGVTEAVALPLDTHGDFWDPVLRAIDEAAYLEDPDR
ncbi:MAG TPA: hypothetical protein VIU61_01930 [Kofleriaceae bacterium]